MYLLENIGFHFFVHIIFGSFKFDKDDRVQISYLQFFEKNILQITLKSKWIGRFIINSNLLLIYDG